MTEQQRLLVPPLSEVFLGLFGPPERRIVRWDDMAQGLFTVWVSEAGGAPPAVLGGDENPDMTAYSTSSSDCQTWVVECDTPLRIPEIPTDERAEDPPWCFHGRPAVRRIVSKRDSPNIGRAFFVCAAPPGGPGRCSFFRWADENDRFSRVRLRPVLRAADIAAEIGDGPSPQLQQAAWAGVQQGSEEWHRLRACRLTASNFGSVHRTNSYATPSDLLRGLLWPVAYDSVPMKYGSCNEKSALRRFAEWLSAHAPRPEFPSYVDEVGIWLSATHPFLAGSPDGIVYVTLDAGQAADGRASWFRCRRSLLAMLLWAKIRG